MEDERRTAELDDGAVEQATGGVLLFEGKPAMRPPAVQYGVPPKTGMLVARESKAVTDLDGILSGGGGTKYS